MESFVGTSRIKELIEDSATENYHSCEYKTENKKKERTNVF